MNHPIEFKIDERLDLLLERTLDVPPDMVWMAWTRPEHLMKWFCPRPWQTVECEIDLRPGGIFRTVMMSPEGQRLPHNIGCYLEVVENRRLVWTDALAPGYRPKGEPEEGCGLGVFMTAAILIEPHGKGGTKYRAIALHHDEAGAKKHAEMGFHEGWGTCADQLVEHIKSLR